MSRPRLRPTREVTANYLSSYQDAAGSGIASALSPGLDILFCVFVKSPSHAGFIVRDPARRNV